MYNSLGKRSSLTLILSLSLCLSPPPPGIEGSDDEALDTGHDDEELSRWEQEQIRKGISIPQVGTALEPTRAVTLSLPTQS